MSANPRQGPASRVGLTGFGDVGCGTSQPFSVALAYSASEREAVSSARSFAACSAIIVVDSRKGSLLPSDGEIEFVEEWRLLDHLHTNQLVQVEKRGKVWTLRPGRRMLDAAQRVAA